ncbi:MAG: hypothetical protein ACNA7G_09265 [Methylobacter sp.]
MKKLILVAALMVMSSQLLAAKRTVNCQIDSGNQVAYQGKCLFLADADGSFSLSNVNENKVLLDEISLVNVYIIDKGIAEVRGLTTDGINSRWGEAKRSEKDKACWLGSDFKVCAW